MTASGSGATTRTRRSTVIGLLTLALVGLTGVERAAAADRVERSPVAVIELEGRIGNSLAVHMRLEVRDIVRGSGASADVVGEDYSGHYSYDRVGRRIALRGRFNAQGMDGAADDPTIEIAEFRDGQWHMLTDPDEVEMEFKLAMLNSSLFKYDSAPFEKAFAEVKDLFPKKAHFPKTPEAPIKKAADGESRAITHVGRGGDVKDAPRKPDPDKKRKTKKKKRPA